MDRRPAVPPLRSQASAATAILVGAGFVVAVRAALPAADSPAVAASEAPAALAAGAIPTAPRAALKVAAAALLLLLPAAAIATPPAAVAAAPAHALLLPSSSSMADTRVRCLSLGRYSSRGSLAGWREDLRNARVVANNVDVVSRLAVTLVCLVSHG